MRTRNWSKKKLLFFSLISILVILLVLEIIFRIVFAVEYKNYHTSLYIQGSTLQMSDSTLVFRNRPFYLDYFKRFQVNEEGMRVNPGDVNMPEKKEGDFWVFVFGGSVMEGTGSNKDGEWLDITGVIDYKPEETIGGCLEKKLQEKMPSKKVRVFNAANAGFMIWQSTERYRQLHQRYHMDWVISMDGENEPPELKPGETVQHYSLERWNKSSIFHFPLNAIIPLTSHSAFMNYVTQFLLRYRFSNRLLQNEKDGYPAKNSWASKPFGSLRLTTPNANSERAVQAFYKQVMQFDSLLTANGQAHRLYIQPHIAFRDTARMNITERALYNYYAARYNDSLNNTFKRIILSSPDGLRGHARLLTNLYTWDKQVFVDYCHFTKEANEYIAELMARDILNNDLK